MPLRLNILGFIALACLAGLLRPGAHSQENGGNFRGIPFYDIFDEKDIGDSTAIHSIVTSPNGTLFLLNENGVFTYDGSTWKQVLETSSTTDKIRSIAWTENGIFAGGYNKIGRLDFSPPNGAMFDALNEEPLIPDSSDNFRQINRIGDKLYFSGSTNIAILDIQTSDIEIAESIPWIKATTVFNDQLLVATSDQGVAVLENRQLRYFSEYTHFNGKDCITDFATTRSGNLFCSTQSGQVYQLSNDRGLLKQPSLVFKTEDTISNLESINPNELALAIPRHGLVVIDDKGAITTTIEKSIDYRWRGCDKLHLDRDGTLWVLFSINSIGKVLINDPLTEIDERLRPTLFYPLALKHKGDSYLLNEGKLYRSEHTEDGRLSGFSDALPEFEGSVAAAVSRDNETIIFANQNAYRFEDEQLTNLGATGKVERIAYWNKDPTYLLGAAPTAATLLKQTENGIEIVESIPLECDLVNKVAQTEDGVFWLEIGLGSLIKIEIVDHRLKIRNYSKQDGLPSNWIAVWGHEGEVLFTERSGIFEYNNKTDLVQRSTRFSEYFPPNTGSIHRISTDPYGNIWASYHLCNYILWKQSDGSYKMEDHSLSQMGALFANQFAFLANGDALLLTGNSLYHVDASKIQHSRNINLDLEEIADASGNEVYYMSLGMPYSSRKFELPAKARSLNFTFKSSFSDTIQLPEYQYYLSGLSDKWSKWSDSNQLSFNNLDYGNYVLEVRTRRPNGDVEAYSGIEFKIEPTFWETPVALLLYITAVLSCLFIGYKVLSGNLKSANLKLERMVAERTKELGQKNEQLKQNAEKLQATLDELRDAQDQIISTSHKAGMAEVATNVLHNVGNVLNSINVGVTTLKKQIQHQRVWKLSKVAELVKAHKNDLPAFFTKDQRGLAIPDYLEKLAEVLIDDLQACQMEIECMDENIDHVKKIIATQQTHAKLIDTSQQFDLGELIDAAISMMIGDLDRAILELNKSVEPNLLINSDKHRILQMITNFIKNAKESIIEARIPLGIINITAERCEGDQAISIRISDNGVGISSENLANIFKHGFTTKNEGHGFGMHSCANSAKALGGDISIDSDGLGLGATVSLTLPINLEASNENRKSRWNYKLEDQVSLN